MAGVRASDARVGEHRPGGREGDRIPAGRASARTVRRPLILALVVAALVAVHAPMLTIHPWGDDFENLYLAYSIHQSPLHALQPNFVFFRPVMLLLMYVNYLLAGTHPLGYNLITLLFLLFNSALLYLVVRKLGGGFGPALAAAALYGSSPLMSEVTTWSGTRADQVMVALSLLLVLVVAGPGRPTSWSFQGLVGTLLLVAAATKESWIVLPVLLPITLLLVRRVRMAVALRASAFGVALAALYVAAFVVWPEVAGHSTPLDYSAEVNDPVQAIGKLLRVGAWYAGFGHPDTSHGTAIVGALLLVGMAVGAVRTRRSDARVGVVLLLALVPTLHFPVSPTRFNALPLAGFWMAVVGLVDHLTRDRVRWRWMAAVLAAGVFALQAALLQVEIRDYRVYGEMYRDLVQAYRRLDEPLPAPGVVVVIDAGSVDGPGTLMQATRGIPKYVYPKPGGLWDLVYFHSLASFAGRPFEVRIEPVPRDRVDGDLIRRAMVLVFDDSGFRRCGGCREELMERMARGEPLPVGVGAWSVIPVAG